MILDVVCWARQTRGGKREDQIRAAFRRAGCAVDQPDDPFYLDRPLEKQPARLDVHHLPDLEAAVHSLMTAGQLVVISLADFSLPRIWEWVAQHLARKGASLRDIESGRVWDFATDPGAGYEISRLVEAMSNRRRTENARARAVAAGKLGPRQKLADEATMKRARRYWGDPTLSGPQAAEKVGIGVATLYRHLGPKTDFEAKVAAEAADKSKKPTR